MVVHGRLDCDELLQRAHASKLAHRPLSPSERLMRIFRSIVEPAPRFMSCVCADHFQGGAIGTKLIGYDHIRQSKSFQRLSQKLQCRTSIPRLGDKCFQHLPFMIDRAPEIARLAVDADEHLVEMPAPFRHCSAALCSCLPYLGREHGTKSIPPEPHRFVADVNTALVQQVFNIAERQREPDVHHHSDANDLRLRLEISERIAHPWRLRSASFQLNHGPLTLPCRALSRDRKSVV